MTANSPTWSKPCSRCGHEIARWPGASTVSCAHCDAQYNASGQCLRDNWSTNTSNFDEDTSDLDGYEQAACAQEHSTQEHSTIRGQESGTTPSIAQLTRALDLLASAAKEGNRALYRSALQRASALGTSNAQITDAYQWGRKNLGAANFDAQGQ